MRTFIISAIAVLALIACNDENPIDAEQYFKQIYIVGADGDMITREVAYDSIFTETFVSVAIGGSLPADRDVNVALVEEPEGIAVYNRKNLSVSETQYQPLARAAYEYATESVTIRAGEVYAKFPITIYPTGLHCDSLYAIPLKIATVSDYSIRAADTVLLVRVLPVNALAGIYFSSTTRQVLPDGAPSSPVGLSRTLTAVNANTVRFIHEAAEVAENISASAITFSVNANNTLTVAAWDAFPLLDGGGTHDPSTETFTYWYTYTSGSTSYRVEGQLVPNENR
ncbi:MAG: DUF1735 domain-containing protein [Odoribacteraceae bacterium]|jgi:hypothetical protein|nr:DUF1735 domain-containing protein [Odoribacteraceae bacterium]